MKRAQFREYWCHPQTGGHPTLYYRGHQHITRAEYIDAVGAPDCDPHIMHGRMKMAKKRKAAKRELIAPRGDKRYVRRKKGRFTRSQDNVGRSLSADRRKKAKRVAKRGQGDKGDRRR